MSDASERRAEIDAILAKPKPNQMSYDERNKVLMFFLGTMQGILDHIDHITYASPSDVEHHMREAQLRMEDSFMRMEQAFKANVREQKEEEGA